MEPINSVQPKLIRGLESVSASGMLTSNPRQEKGFSIDRSQPEKKQSETEKAMHAKLERIAEAMDNYVRSIQRELKIQVHDGTGDIMVKVISEEDGKVIREIPPKELLDLAAKMEEMTGALLNENA